MQAVPNIRKKDVVQVMVGREKGKTGKVLRVLKKKGTVVIEKLNQIKRHTRPTGTTPGGIIEKEAPIAISNVMLYCDKCAKGVRFGLKKDDKGKTTRICRKCNSNLK
ncbi:MAG: 50S ribosomal protein L24 [Bdellovibrionota bacterium]